MRLSTVAILTSFLSLAGVAAFLWAVDRLASQRLDQAATRHVALLMHQRGRAAQRRIVQARVGQAQGLKRSPG